MQNLFIQLGKEIQADYILYRIYDGFKWEYMNHIVVLYYMKNREEIASIQPSDLTRYYQGEYNIKPVMYNRKWGEENHGYYLRYNIG